MKWERVFKKIETANSLEHNGKIEASKEAIVINWQVT